MANRSEKFYRMLLVNNINDFQRLRANGKTKYHNKMLKPQPSVDFIMTAIVSGGNPYGHMLSGWHKSFAVFKEGHNARR